MTDSISFYLWLPQIRPTQTPSEKAALPGRGLPPLSAERFTSGHVIAVVNEISQFQSHLPVVGLHRCWVVLSCSLRLDVSV